MDAAAASLPIVRLHDPARWPAQRAALAEAAGHGIADAAALARLLRRTSHAEHEVALVLDGAIVAADPAFWTSTLPFVATLALRSAELLGAADGDAPSHPLRYLPPDARASVSLTREQVACVLALAFFDAIAPFAGDAAWDMPPALTFRHWLDAASGDECDAQKAACLALYFAQTRRELEAADAAAPGAADASDAARVVVTRLALRDDGERAAAWAECDAPLSPLRVVDAGGIESAARARQADFANEYVGGGVLCGGCVQEEIRFAVSPECLVAILLCARMRDHEAILLQGVRQFAEYTGYGYAFACAGPAEDRARAGEEVVALDALMGGGARQYDDGAMLRELRKLRAALGDGGEAERADGGAAAPFATGNWGCGVFGGDARLKALLQWMAASRARRDVLYYPFGDPNIAGLRETAERLLARRTTVGQLARALAGKGAALADGRAFDVVLAALAPDG